MKRIIVALVLISLVASCNRDHRQETISAYVHTWQKGDFVINKLENVKSITGKDSTEALIKEYTENANPLPSLDTVLSRIERDITYNTNLLAKTNQKIDSLTAFQKKANVSANDDFMKAYAKSFTDLRDFTTNQIEELKYYRFALKKYSEDANEVFSYQVLCEYKLSGSSTQEPRVVTQNFFLSPDTRKVLAVK